MDCIQVPLNFKCERRKIERVGPAFLKLKTRNVAEHITRSDSDDKLIGAEFEVDINYLRSLDPKEWKDQDHYAVLGLKTLRFDATDDDIRRAYRRMVLQHHPDKRKAKGEDVKTEEDYFTCITKAYEILGTPKTRRAYDSVDPEFDDAFPSQSDIDNNFYASFAACFERNARWSEKRNVPNFGNDESPREEVEKFYNFWYDFKSWREYSYLDEEDKEKGEDRIERRWIEKENRVARMRMKKEEMTRIRALVDLAYKNDKRVQRFKQEEKERKLAAKRAKMDAAKAQKDEQDRAVREAQQAKERAEKAEQKRIEQIRLEKEQQKRALKKERKQLRDKAKECKYWGSNDKENVKHMEGVEKICETFSIAELQELNKNMEGNGKAAFLAALHAAESKIKAELEEINNLHNKKVTKDNAKEVSKAEMWTNDNVQLLIKAVNLFPAGTMHRWEVVAAYINQHSTTAANVNARDVLNKAKAMQNSDFSKNSLKSQANDAAFESFEKSKKDVQTCNDITINTDEEVKSNGIDKAAPENHIKENGINKTAEATEAAAPQPASKSAKKEAVPKAWSKEEQALLEQAIKTYPSTTADRWDRIAECVPNKTKKDCLRRVKELVELVNSKKEAQQAVK